MIFFYDMFDDSCDKVSIGDYRLSCLMYADDVVLLSSTEKGLQLCLDKLDHVVKHGV